MLNGPIRYFLQNRLVSVIILVVIVAWGVVTAPFGWNTGFLPSDPVPVDAIPDIGENQQIVFTEWPGRSPQDIEDQITYPLTTSLLGMPGVRSIRSTSMFGLSSIYIIFNDDIEFYWSRSRVLEKLNSLPANLLPDDVQPALGPDATGLGQVFWYTLEGRDAEGKVTGGWDLHEIRTVQDFYVKYALNAVEGVAEVASIGGFVQEYQVDVNPSALKAYGIGIDQVMMAVKNANRDTGAKTIEINSAEYLVRGLGYVKSTADLEQAVVSLRDNVPVRIRDIGTVTLGPAERRGVLDKEGAEVVGGVVVARYGSNPLSVIDRVREKITEISSGLPKKELRDGTISQLTLVPFYDRTQLIHETVGTLERALSHEVLISIIVVVVLVLNLRASLLISGLLPVAVLATFVVMRYTGVDANIVALSGIAIAIGVMVDVGIVFVENIVRHLQLPENRNVRGTELANVIYKAATEVVSAITTALATTVVSFLPVFALESAEAKLFHPLAFTKTFALAASFFIGIVVLPALSHFVFSVSMDSRRAKRIWNVAFMVAGLVLSISFKMFVPLALVLLGVVNLLKEKWPEAARPYSSYLGVVIVVVIASYYLTKEWAPLGHDVSLMTNFLFVVILLGIVLGALLLMVRYYEPLLTWCLANKGKFLLIPAFTILFGIVAWLGFDKVFGFIPRALDHTGVNVRTSGAWSAMVHAFPGMGREFMPSLDEGTFLLMPTTMPHAGLSESHRIVQQLDILVAQIPEVEVVVGKLGRAESALDPAPVSMFENVISYKPEFILDERGHPIAFLTNDDGDFILASGDSVSNRQALAMHVKAHDLIPSDNGRYFRNWRDEIRSTDDIWNEIVKVTALPGVTSAPRLQPIETRLVMLQTGMRAPMGIKVFGKDLQTIQDFALQLEGILKQVPSVKPETVFADRISGKPYLNLRIDRNAISRYGISIEELQQAIEISIGGMPVTSTVEGRERFPVRVRYPRELRDNPDAIKSILVPTAMGTQVPLGELVEVEYAEGAQMIRSEDTFLVGYVLFDKRDGYAEVDAVDEAARFIEERVDSGNLRVPDGVSYRFSGNYENQVRAVQRLSVIIPVSLLIIFLLLYFQFKTVTASSIHFSGVFVALAGGFIMMWLYGQEWFMDFSVAGTNMRDLFQMHTINLSVAVWVGFIALFGIATDDGVIMGTYIHQVFEERRPSTVTEVREAVLTAGKRRVRPAMMTAAVAIIALLPVLTSTGKGADIMVPMAIPTLGGMVIQIMTIFVVPVLQAIWRERGLPSGFPPVNDDSTLNTAL